MCSAYTLTQPGADIIRSFHLAGESDFQPKYNIRPSNRVPIITQGEDKGISTFYWGISPGFAKNKAIAEKLYNLRLETIAESSFFRNALEQRRCLIPADGFYAWRQISSKGQVPYRYFISENKLFAFAGLWEEFEDVQGDTIHTFSIITTMSNDVIAQTSPRMPVIFSIDDGLAWLDNATDLALKQLDSLYNDELTGFAVSPKVNQHGYDDPKLIEPATPADQFGNYSLFD